MCQLSHGPIFPTNTLFQAANTIHVFVEPVSKVQVSAKEIRSRIFGGGNHKPEVPSTPEVSQTPKIRTEMVLTSPASSTTTTDVEFLESTHLTSASAGGDSFRTSLEDTTADDRFELFVLRLFISKSFRFNNRLINGAGSSCSTVVEHLPCGYQEIEVSTPAGCQAFFY